MPTILPTITLPGLGGLQYTFLVTQGPLRVPYFELLQYQEHYEDGANTATRTCICLWEQRYQFRDDMLGTATFVPGNIVGGVDTGISREIPEVHPWDDDLFAVQADLEPLGVPTSDREQLAKALTSQVLYGEVDQADSNNLVSFNLAQVTVTYSVFDFSTYSDSGTPFNGLGELNRYVSRYYDTGGENQQYPSGGFKFVSDGSVIQEPGAFTLATQEVKYVWRRVPGLALGNIVPVIGHANMFLFDNYWQPNQLVCLPAKAKKYRTAAGDFVYDITYTFVNRAYPNADWNSLFRIHTGGVAGNPPGFESIIGVDGVTLATPQADFMRLFTIDPVQ